MITIEEITKICENICADAGYDFTIPVKINKRLTKTLGRVHWIRKPDGNVYSTLMEFSNLFLETSTEHSILEVIKHECAHYLVIAETYESHGHDQVFKEMCARINCTNDGTHYNTIERTVPEDKIYKYIVTCKSCHSIVGKYQRAGKVIKHPENYHCTYCHGNLKVTQNW